MLSVYSAILKKIQNSKIQQKAQDIKCDNLVSSQASNASIPHISAGAQLKLAAVISWKGVSKRISGSSAKATRGLAKILSLFHIFCWLK